MWIVKAALKNPYAVIVLALMIVVLGVLAVLRIPKDILPVFKAPAVEVLTFFQGMPASSMEKTVTNRIERWVNQAPGPPRSSPNRTPASAWSRFIFATTWMPTAP